MNLITGNPFTLAVPKSGGCVMLGYMDGIHVGHQRLAERVNMKAGECRSFSAAFSFNGLLFTKSIPSFRGLLTPHDEKVERLESIGIDTLYLIDFTERLKEMPAHDFVRFFLKDKLDARFVACGPGFSFGKGGLGKSNDLVKYCNELGIEAEVIGSVQMDGKPVSSTRIRSMLLEGQVEEASRMLGRNYTIKGSVVHGHGIGRNLGIPTANLEVPDKMKLVPGDGVYACIARFDGMSVMSALSIGLRPTFDDTERSIEAHLLDFDGILYNHNMEIEFISYLRAQRAFATKDELVSQIEIDIEKTKTIVGGLQ